MDLMRAVNNYAFIACACGLKMKIPPDVPQDATIACPRCGRGNKVPIAEVAAVGAMVGAVVGSEAEPTPRSTAAGPVLQYARKGTGWETFSCDCGRLIQLSPAFEGKQMTCKSCGRSIRIV